MIRLKDIAEKAGVSIRTVGRVLNDEAHVKPEIVSRVKKIVDELNYTPNLIAQSLKMNVNRNIHLIIPTIKSILTERMHGIEKSLKNTSYVLQINLIKSMKNVLEEMVPILNQKPAGVILYSFSLIGDIVKELKARNIPFVVFEGQSTDFNSIDFDRGAGIEESIRHLYDKGCRKIAFMGHNIPDNLFSKARIEGYESGIAKVGLKPIYFGLPKSAGQFIEARVIGKNFQNLEDKPDAIQAYSDSAAMGFLAGLHDVGFDHKKVRVVGFNDMETAAYASPPLTTISMPEFDLGLNGAEMLLDNIREGLSNQVVCRKLPTKLVVRESG